MWSLPSFVTVEEYELPYVKRCERKPLPSRGRISAWGPRGVILGSAARKAVRNIPSSRNRLHLLQPQVNLTSCLLPPPALFITFPELR